MSKFLVLYQAPPSVLDEWMKTDPEVRKEEEAKMRSAWNTWMEVHGKSIIETAGAGKTKHIEGGAVTDIKNNVMLYSLVEAESADEVVEMFKAHPHFGIPEASIEVMQANPLTGM
jgi:hypothetical protein